MKSVGIKPIIGMESYFTNNRFEKKGEGSDDILTDKNYHLILFAKDKTGFKNLMKLSSLAYTEGFYYKPAGVLGVHLDAMQICAHIPQTQYPAGALAAALFLISGTRGLS